MNTRQQKATQLLKLITAYHEAWKAIDLSCTVIATKKGQITKELVSRTKGASIGFMAGCLKTSKSRIYVLLDQLLAAGEIEKVGISSYIPKEKKDGKRT